ncbi:MAG: DEAD/DEAH box helicase [Paramuribaculum sp.]|nr:DEAD/DEAH box helicase [Paramuribaculum sp.]
MDTKTITQNIKLRHGIDKLNPMQQQMLSLKHPAAVLIAPTGSGKTLAFAANMLAAMHKPCGAVQTIILAPSRELVLQIHEVIRPIASGFKTTVLYGGHRMLDEISSLTPIPDIIIATPGRLLDHLQRGTLNIKHTRILVLDEYDKSLEMGFAEEMSRIVRRILRPERIILTSATELGNLPTYLPVNDPIVIKAQQTTHPAKRTQIVEVPSPERDKANTLVQLLHSLPNDKVIVFVNHRESAERVHTILKRQGIPAGLYHGGLEQMDRDNALTLLHNGTTPILVSTDLGSRGIDVQGVGSVIHYHMPPSAESWTHRNGRTARINNEGTVYVITAEGENRPEYVTTDRSWIPTGQSSDPITASMATLHINAGKKEKISKGDIVGFLLAHTALDPQSIGTITLRDHNALVAVPKNSVNDILQLCIPHKLKGKKIRISILR